MESMLEACDIESIGYDEPKWILLRYILNQGKRPPGELPWQLFCSFNQGGLGSKDWRQILEL